MAKKKDILASDIKESKDDTNQLILDMTKYQANVIYKAALKEKNISFEELIYQANKPNITFKKAVIAAYIVKLMENYLEEQNAKS